MTKVIEVTIKPDGTTEVATTGFVGSECQQASQFLERALGQRTTERLTVEFHQVAEMQSLTQHEPPAA